MAAWSTERTALFTKLWAEGLSASEIAEAINKAEGCDITRCAVIGKMNRAHSKPKGRNTSTGACRRSVKASGKADTRKLGGSDRITKLSESKESTVQVVNSVLALTNKQCRWPIGDLHDVDFGFCKEPQLAHKSYCVKHASIAYVKWRPKLPHSKPANYSPKEGSREGEIGKT